VESAPDLCPIRVPLPIASSEAAASSVEVPVQIIGGQREPGWEPLEDAQEARAVGITCGVIAERHDSTLLFHYNYGSKCLDSLSLLERSS